MVRATGVTETTPVTVRAAFVESVPPSRTYAVAPVTPVATNERAAVPSLVRAMVSTPVIVPVVSAKFASMVTVSVSAPAPPSITSVAFSVLLAAVPLVAPMIVSASAVPGNVSASLVSVLVW